MNWKTSSTDFGVSRMLSDLSNQNRLHGAHAEISIGRSVPKASSTSGAIRLAAILAIGAGAHLVVKTNTPSQFAGGGLARKCAMRSR